MGSDATLQNAGEIQTRLQNGKVHKPNDAICILVLPTTPFVKTLVRWATCKRLTFCLPKLSLLTLFPPLNSGILGLRMGPCVPTLKFFSYLGGPRKSDSSDSYHEKIHFSLNKRFHGGHEIQTHDQRTIVLPTTPYVR